MKAFPSGLGIAIGFALLFLAPVRGDDSIAFPHSRATDIDQKLKATVVSVDFTNATIDQAIAALTIKSQQAAPYRKGVVFLIEPEASADAKPITLKLDNVPLGETIRYVCLLGNVRYKVSDTLIRIIPRYGGEDGLVKRTYHVDPDFVSTVSRAGVIPAPHASP